MMIFFLKFKHVLKSGFCLVFNEFDLIIYSSFNEFSMNCGLQQLHEAGKTDFVLPGGSIPEWLDKESWGPSISFWFRNQFPPKVLCFFIASVRNDIIYHLVRPVVLINGKVQGYKAGYYMHEVMAELDHMQLFDLHVLPFSEDLMKMASEKEWKHVEITYQGLLINSFIKAMGIHIVKSERRGMEDIRYDDPNTTTKVWPCNFSVTFLPFFFRFLFALILFLTLLIHLDFVNLSSLCVFNLRF